MPTNKSSLTNRTIAFTSFAAIAEKNNTGAFSICHSAFVIWHLGVRLQRSSRAAALHKKSVSEGCLLCGALRSLAISAVNGHFNAEIAEGRRAPQRN
jgi:hypothetical protein